MRRQHLIAIAAAALFACSAAGPRDNAADLRTSSMLDDVFEALADKPDPLDRWRLVEGALAKLDSGGRQRLLQTRAAIEAELGLHRQAQASFPFPGTRAPPAVLPSTDSHIVDEAVDHITTLAHERRIVLVNEAHHAAQTRILSLALLPRLRALGYTHFAAEALDEADIDLARRGYPTAASGSYIREPLYGELIRTALRLGYVVVPYEHRSASGDLQERETGQAQHLMQRVFDRQPDARLFVHAGYAHIDLRPGRLWEARPMAVELQRLSGHAPLSVEQTLLLASQDGRDAEWLVDLLDAFAIDRPSVLVDRSDEQPWAYDPGLHHLSVLLPRDDDGAPRPSWLDASGSRHPWPIDPDLCADTFPCLIQAHHGNEPDAAIAADRHAWLSPPAQASTLYLPPGRYRLTASNERGHRITAPTRIVVPHDP